jgi:hypothetical protein
MKKTIILLILSLLVLQVSWAQKNKKVILAHQYKVGKKYQYKFLANQHISVSGMELPQVMDMGMEYEIVSVDKEGIANVKITYTSIRFMQDNPMMGKMEYDSESTTAPDEKSQMFAQAFGKLKGKWVVVKMKKNGQITESVEGDPQLMKVMNEQVSGGIGALPEKKLKVGDTWTTEENRNTNGIAMNVKTTNTLKALENGKWIIESQGTIQDEKGNPMGTQTGKTEFDAKDLMIVKAIIKQDIKEMQVQGMKMQLKSENNIEAKAK